MQCLNRTPTKEPCVLEYLHDSNTHQTAKGRVWHAVRQGVPTLDFSWEGNGQIATDPDTGAQKLKKDIRYDLLPVLPIAEISRVYAYGEQKYSSHNWRGGYDWSLSYAALQRHLSRFWDGEDNDPESGLPHLSHAGFHILALLEFMHTNRQKDDRYATAKSRELRADARTAIGNAGAGDGDR